MMAQSTTLSVLQSVFLTLNISVYKEIHEQEAD